MRKQKTTSRAKIKAKPLKRLPKKLGDEAYAYTAAIVEDLKSSFRVVAENQYELSNKVDVLSKDMEVVKADIRDIKISQDVLREDVSELKERMGSVEDRQTRMEADIREIKQELKSIRGEMAELRMLLSQKADIARLNSLEERVARIEQSLVQRP